MTAKTQTKKTVAKKAIEPPPVRLVAGYPGKPWAKPPVAMALLVLAAKGLELAETATGLDWEIAMGTAAVAFTVAVVCAVRSKSTLMTKKLRRRYVAALLAGASWLTAVPLIGVGWGATLALTLVGVALSAHYWQVHRIQGRPKGRWMPQVNEQDMFVERWEKNLGGPTRPLAGSRLLPRPILIKSGYQYTLELVPGTHTTEGVRNMTAQIRGGLRLLRGQEVIVEGHPTEAEPTALLTIVTKSTVMVDQPWPGPDAAFDPSTGAVNMGPFVDGEDVAKWTTYRTNGMFGGFLQGSPGSGKSRLLETIALALASSTTHPTIIWFACGQGGASSTMLRKRADNFAGTGDEFLEMLIQAEKALDVNSAENDAWGLDGFTPGWQTVVEKGVEKRVHRRGLLIIVDEFQNFTGRKRYARADEVQERMTRIEAEGRKAGVRIIAATQSPFLGESFGEGKYANKLRSCLLSGNGVLLQSQTRDAKSIFGVDINPQSFPKLPGYGFLAQPDPDARSAPFRSYYVTDQTMAEWVDFITWHELTFRQATLAGRSYADRKAKLVKRRVAVQSFLDDLDSGRSSLIDAVEEEMEKAMQTVAAEGVSVGDFTFPTQRMVKKFWTETEESGEKEAELNNGQRTILAAVQSGRTQPATIMEATGYSRARVNQVLPELIKMGYVTYDDYKTYRSTASA